MRWYHSGAEQKYLNYCLDLATKGLGYTKTNPLVGCVIVHQDRIIGQGYHQKFGGGHAEINAIEDVYRIHGSEAPGLLRKSRLYVNLEPCCHHGKTPPCTGRIIKEGIPQVVVGMTDPFEEVNGGGIDQLLLAGIQVKLISEDIPAQAVRFTNRRFLSFHQLKRPYILLKWAQSPQGYMARQDGIPHWISGPATRVLVHKWRSQEGAILAGPGTIAMDNPNLNNRLWEGPSPIRIVLDWRGNLNLDLKVFNRASETWYLGPPRTKLPQWVKHIPFDFGDYWVQEFFYLLYLKEVPSVMIEGGPALLQKFLDRGLWDEARVITGTEAVPGEPKALKAPVIKETAQRVQSSGPDSIAYYYNSSVPTVLNRA